MNKRNLTYTLQEQELFDALESLLYVKALSIGLIPSNSKIEITGLEKNISTDGQGVITLSLEVEEIYVN